MKEGVGPIGEGKISFAFTFMVVIWTLCWSDKQCEESADAETFLYSERARVCPLVGQRDGHTKQIELLSCFANCVRRFERPPESFVCYNFEEESSRFLLHTHVYTLQ